jgi:ribosomal protein S27E
MDGNGRYLDGNAAAGALAAVFAFDVTTTRVVCNGCQAAGVLADAHVYALELGAVLRCPACGETLLRMSRLEGECRIDLRGISVMRVVTSDRAGPAVTGG